MRGICYLGNIENDNYQLLRLKEKWNSGHVGMGKDAVFSKVSPLFFILFIYLFIFLMNSV